MKTTRWRGRAGQSLVEMAMVLPILAILTFGLVDFGRGYYFQVSITNAAREGARVAILNIYVGPQTPICSSSNSYATCPVQTDANIITAVFHELNYSGIPPTSITICRQPDSHECVGANEDELLMLGHQRRRKSRGQAMVEFALLASLLFLLVMGIFDFGRAISVYINIAEAAHEGARQLVLRSNYASKPPDSVIVNATLAKIGGGGMVLTEDPCLSNPTPCTFPSLPGVP